MTIRSYKDLVVWQKSVKLAILIYKYTSDFPKEELYGIVQQLRRCAVSIPSNIAEGWARKNTGEFINSLSMSDGSAAELDTQLILCKELQYGDEKLRIECQSLLEEIQKMLPSLMKSLKRSSS